MLNPRYDITGKVYESLTVLKYFGMDKHGKNSIWTCQCSCGVKINVTRCNLIQRSTKSCGCLNYENDEVYEKTQEERFFRYVLKTESCWIWKGGLDKEGYGIFNHRTHKIKSHRYSFGRFKEPIKKGLVICHTCDNPKCVNPDHLYQGTQIDNMKDVSIRKRWIRTKKSLTEKQKEACQILYKNGFSMREIAEVLNISNSGVKNYVN